MQPELKHVVPVVQLYAAAGQYDQARRLISDMSREHDAVSNIAVYNAFLKVCVTASHVPCARISRKSSGSLRAAFGLSMDIQALRAHPAARLPLYQYSGAAHGPSLLKGSVLRQQGAVDHRSAQAAQGRTAEGFSDQLMDLRGELAQVSLSPSLETFALLTELYVLAGDIKVTVLLLQDLYDIL